LLEIGASALTDSMPVLNFTQHRCTQDQLDAGILDCPDSYYDKLKQLLTFDELPAAPEVWHRARQIANLFEQVAVDLGFDYATNETSLHAMIGGAPFLMANLEDALDENGVLIYYAFSKRESVDQQQPDGSVKKVTVFRHAGLYFVGNV
jgi:hypothetical protein